MAKNEKSSNGSTSGVFKIVDRNGNALPAERLEINGVEFYRMVLPANGSSRSTPTAPVRAAAPSK